MPDQARSSRIRDACAALLLLAAVFAAYSPALGGGFLWDDDAHVTRPELRSFSGLRRIWFDVGATQQYYPLLHSVFWVQHRLFGDSPAYYHCVNVAFHAAASFLVLLVVRRVLEGRPYAQLAGALSAAVFALHPVQVESVAWITEQKNTLSAVFYLSSMLAYLRFDRGRRSRFYALATFLFVLGLLTKTVTATLPAALLVVFWWQRGRLSFRRDIAPLLPWLVLGAASGLFTAWFEHNVIGAEGEEFELTALQRTLLAPRTLLFYVGKLFWPANLIFIYPRWTIDPRSLAAWLYASAAMLLGVFGLLAARRTRGPLAGALFFAGTLFPVLGFLNVYPFLFSFVADHFQYLASLGVIVPICAAIALAARRAPPPVRAAVFILPIALAVLTVRQARLYADAQTLYRATIERNPTCWMAHNNLGVVLKEQGHPDEAIEQYRAALLLRPDYPRAHNNLGMAFAALGRHGDAIAAFREALRLRPANPETLSNLAGQLTIAGRNDEAIDALRRAVAMDPKNPALRINLGAAYQAAGQPSLAVPEYRRALALDPASSVARTPLRVVEALVLPREAAIAALKDVVRDEPANAQALFSLALLLSEAGRTPEAIDQYFAAVRADPANAEAHNNLAALLATSGRLNDAIPEFEETVRLRPDRAEVLMNLAVAYLQAGRLPDALDAAKRARTTAARAGSPALVAQIESWIAAHPR